MKANQLDSRAREVAAELKYWSGAPKVDLSYKANGKGGLLYRLDCGAVSPILPVDTDCARIVAHCARNLGATVEIVGGFVIFGW